MPEKIVFLEKTVGMVVVPLMSKTWRPLFVVADFDPSRRQYTSSVPFPSGG